MGIVKKLFSSYWFKSIFLTSLKRISTTLFGFLNFLFLTRYLNKYQLGVWSVFLVICVSVEMGKYGFHHSAHIKFVSSCKDNAEKKIIAWSSLMINIFTSVLFFLMIMILGDWGSHMLNMGSDLYRMLILFIPGIIGLIFFNHYEAVQMSHFNFTGPFYGNLVRQSSLFFFIVLYQFIRIPMNLEAMVIYYSIGIIMGAVTLYFFSREYVSYKYKATWVWIKKFFGFGGPLLGSNIISNLHSNVDQLISARMLSPVAVSYYSAASRISAINEIPVNAAADVLLPKMSQASSEQDNTMLRYYVEKSIGSLMGLTLPFAVLSILFAKLLTVIIAGKMYAEAALILQIYFVRGLMGIPQKQYANALVSIGQTKKHFVLNSIDFANKIWITVIFFKIFGFYGAAFASIALAILNFAIWHYVIDKEIGISIKETFKHMLQFYRENYVKVHAYLMSKKQKSVL